MNARHAWNAFVVLVAITVVASILWDSSWYREQRRTCIARCGAEDRIHRFDRSPFLAGTTCTCCKGP